jgi:tetratricopeptide (TPR) repeat protein
MIRHFVGTIGLAVVLAAVSSPSVVWAQTEEGGGAAGGESLEVVQARKHFSQGLKLYKDGDFDAALVQFERAYAVKPNYKVLYNIAQSYFELRQYVEARDSLTRYLKDGGDAIDAERRASVEKDLAELQSRISHLKLLVNVAGAAVYVDGKKVGTTPLAGSVDVSEGQRTIAVESANRGSKQRVVRVAGGEEHIVEIAFEAQANPAQTASALRVDQPPTATSTGLGAGFWVTGVSALVLGAGAGVTGYLTLESEKKHDAKLDELGVRQNDLDDSRDKTKTLALTTDILAGGAVLFAGIATVLLITHDSDPHQVGLSVAPGRVALSGKF